MGLLLVCPAAEQTQTLCTLQHNALQRGVGRRRLGVSGLRFGRGMCPKPQRSPPTVCGRVVLET